MSIDSHKSVEERWGALRSRIGERWPELSKQDLKAIGGDSRKLIALVHQRCGERLSTIEEEIDRIAQQSEGLLQRVTRQASDATQAGVDYLSDSYSAARANVQWGVRRAPLSSAGLAFVAGAALGMLLGRSLVRSVRPIDHRWWN